MTFMSLPYLQALREQAQRAFARIESMPAWDPETLAMYFRQATLTGPGLDAVVMLPHEPIDLTTFALVSPERNAPLHARFQVACNAAAAAQLLFEPFPNANARHSPTPIDSTLATVRRLYTDAVVLRAQGAGQTYALGIAPASVDDFKRTAVRCMVQLGEIAPARPWSVLVAADPRWSLAAPASVRAQLHADVPSTRPWLDAFELQLHFFPAMQALDKIWSSDVPKMPSPQERAVFALPDLGM